MGRKPHSDVIVFDGRRYTWSSKGYWRCTTMGDRHNLARRIWYRENGPIPPGHKVIYLDGNRFNLSLANLGCFSHAEVQKRRLQNPEYRAIALAQGFYGLLINRVKESLNPSLARERAMKAWATRVLRYGPSGGNVGHASQNSATSNVNT